MLQALGRGIHRGSPSVHIQGPLVFVGEDVAGIVSVLQDVARPAKPDDVAVAQRNRELRGDKDAVQVAAVEIVQLVDEVCALVDGDLAVLAREQAGVGLIVELNTVQAVTPYADGVGVARLLQADNIRQ